MRGGERQSPYLRCPLQTLHSKIRTPNSALQIPNSTVTDEEFQRIKEAEKERLRAQKRLRATLESLKRRNEVQSVVRKMSRGAKRLLEQTEALADTLASKAAQQAARLEVVMEDSAEDDASLAEDEEILREERAQTLVRRFKARERSTASGRSGRSSGDPDDSFSSDADDEDVDDGPDKTIGRMGKRRTDDST